MAAERKMEVAFEFFEKLGAPFWCFHDFDIAPEGATFKESVANVDRLADLAGEHQKRTGMELLWGTAKLFANRRFMAGAATNPDPEVFAYAAGQVAHCLDVTHRLGGRNYVLWGGREGYDTLLNTDLKREGDQLARFLHLVVDHTVVSPLQLLHDLGYRPLPIAQAEDVRARPVQDRYRLRPQQHVSVPRPIERQPNVGRQLGTAPRWHCGIHGRLGLLTCAGSRPRQRVTRSTHRDYSA